MQESFNGTHFGWIKQAANVAGNFEGFPFVLCFFWAGNTDDPCSMMSANDMCNVLSYVVSHGQEQNFRMQKVISDILYLKSPTQIYLYQLIL